MSASPLDVTKSAGNSNVNYDKKFNDATDIGGFPFAQNIARIQRAEIFSDTNTTDNAVITGLKVTYIVAPANETMVVSHGDVGAPKVGEIVLEENQVLVGVSGKFKNTTDPYKNGRISFIVFTIFNKDDGLTIVQGPFGDTRNTDRSWASYGPIIAFQGSTATYGLTTLGFVKLKEV